MPAGISRHEAYKGGAVRALHGSVNARPLLHFAPGTLELISLSFPYPNVQGTESRARYYFIHHHVGRGHLARDRKPALDRSILEHGFASLALGPARRKAAATPLLELMEADPRARQSPGEVRHAL